MKRRQGSQDFFYIRMAFSSAALVLTLFFSTTAALSQALKCSTQADTLEQQVKGPKQDLATQAGLCIGDKAGDFASAFHTLIDVVEKPDISPKLREATIWAAGRIAETRRVDTDLANALAKDLIPLLQNQALSIPFRRACSYTLGRLSESLATQGDNTEQNIAGQSVSALATVLSDRTPGWTSPEHLTLLASAAEAIGRLGPQGRLATREIIRLLRDSEDAIRSQKEVTKEQMDGIHRLQATLAQTLGEIHPDTTNTEQGLALIELLKQNDNTTKEPATYALAKLGPRPEIQDGRCS